MAVREELKFNTGKLDEAFELVCHFFDVQHLHDDQKKALRGFFSGKDLYFSAPTGFGKSLIFQSIPLVIDHLKDQAIGTTMAIVVSPLKSLMQDQVEQLKRTGVSAAAVFDGQLEDILKGIENGDYSLVYSSPESMLSIERWRRILTSPDFRNRCQLLVIDEAHCVVHWGTAGGDSKCVPFRVWYGNLIELMSLLTSARLAVFTATASKSTKRKIFEMLNINPLTTYIIEKDPNKNNFRYAVRYIENDLSLQDVFHGLINEVRTKSVDTEGTLLFCRTRKHCSLIFRAFTAALGIYIYHGRAAAKNRMVDMFHAGTPESVKNHILSTVTSSQGHIRVLICTIAFGMGIDCQYITRVIHFGGSKCIESYLQECGRAGRKGQQSTCILYHNGMLMRYSDEDMKNYVSSQNCRRKEISAVFPNSQTTFTISGCKCCDVCAADCHCGEKDCLQNMSLIPMPVDVAKPSRIRTVTKEARKLLAEKLESYRLTFLPSNLDKLKPVSFPAMFYEFGQSQIDQVIKNCHLLFSFSDIKKYVEIWRNLHANNVLVVLHEVFNDFYLDTANIELTIEDDDNIIDSDWIDIRDDSVITDIDNSGLYQNADTTSEDADLSQNSGNDPNSSALFETIATESVKYMDAQFENVD